MARIHFTKKQVQVMADVLNDEYDDVTEAAEAALETALDLLSERAKFTVVGQLNRQDGALVPPGDERAEKVALGYYATERQATDDALKMSYSTQTHEEFRAWVLPIHWGTPNDFYIERKKAKKVAEAADGTVRERELQRRLTWVAENPDKPLPPEFMGAVPFHDERSAV